VRFYGKKSFMLRGCPGNGITFYRIRRGDLMYLDFVRKDFGQICILFLKGKMDNITLKPAD
jgi:hypothetical protein